MIPPIPGPSPCRGAPCGDPEGEGRWSVGACPLTIRQQLSLSVFWLSLNFQSGAQLAIVVPTQVLLFVSVGSVASTGQAVFVGEMSALIAFIALVAQPAVGALSDRSTASLGRRRPYIAAGTAVLLAGLFVLALARHAVPFVAGLALSQIGVSIAVGGYQGLLPDRVPPQQRGAASGFLGMMTILGNLASLIVAGLLLSSLTAHTVPDIIAFDLQLYYAVTAAVIVAGALVTLMGVKEAPSPAAPGSAGLDAWIDPWRHAGFRWVFLARASVMFGLTLFMTYIEYYLAGVSGVTNFAAATAVLAALALVGAVMSAILVGVLSDRTRRVPWVVVGTGCMAAATLWFVLAPGGTSPAPLGVLFGVGYGMYTSVDWALAVDVLPSLADAGKDLGLWSVASTLPAVPAPLIGGLIIGWSGSPAAGYRAVFALAAVTLVAGAVMVRFIREPRRGPGMGWWLASRSGGGRARGFLRVWPIWEWIAMHVLPAAPIPHSRHHLLLTRVERYHGPPMRLPDGTRIAAGDRVLRLHLNNRSVVHLTAAGPMGLLEPLRDELRALAAWSVTGNFPNDVHALYGETLLGAGAVRVGFTTRRLPDGFYPRLQGFYMRGLMAVYGRQGVRRLGRGRATLPHEVWMSLDRLRAQYDDAGSTPARELSPRTPER